eukprot:TRINITY_DN33533_c0_g1_i1.p1 TRINITY_DN33533_c0_g1~~TRINITY_DN33533_c0_g1_i1.p1  ORF type:complete len:527 (+),score=93.25 TRINITY_DN33533_c0_g1_i1:93-1583(+)
MPAEHPYRESHSLSDSGSEYSDENYETAGVSKGKAKQDSKWDKVAVPVVFLTFIVVRAMDRVFLYRVQKSMENYTATLMALYWPPMVQFMCFLVCLAYVLKKRCIDGDKSFGPRWFSPFNRNASTQGQVPITWMAQFSFWDQLNAILSAPPSPFIPLVLQTPLNNTVVAWTALIAYFYLKTRFKMVHYAGIILILLSCLSGVVVELQGPPSAVCAGLKVANETMFGIPSIPESVRKQVEKAKEDCVIGLPPYKDATGKVTFIPISILSVMYILYMVAIIPSAFVNCYKQKKLKQADLNIMWSFFWAGMWQVLWGILMYPLTWVPWPTPTGHNEASPSTLGQDLQDSWTCFLGTNPSPSVTTCAQEPAWVWFMVYLLFNVFFNLLFMWLIKRLSGTWASIGSILCGNLCGIFGQFAFFAGDSAAPLSMEQWLALALSSLAMVVYNLEDEADTKGNSVYASKEGGDHRYDEHGRMGLDPDSEAYASEEVETMQDHTLF